MIYIIEFIILTMNYNSINYNSINYTSI